MKIETPTLDIARAIGLRDLQAVCTGCGQRFAVPISAINLPGHTPLELIGALRQISCDECSAPSEIDVSAIGFGPP